MTAGIFAFNLPIWIAFILTIILEFIVYIVAIRQNFWKVLGYCALINIFTFPLANLFYGYLYNGGDYLFLIIEFFVFLVEFVLIMLLFKNKWWKALIISFIANLISTVLGLFISMILIGTQVIY